jgi:hypothetical protein
VILTLAGGGALAHAGACADAGPSDEGRQSAEANEGGAPGDPPEDVPDSIRVISEIAFQPSNRNPCVPPNQPLAAPTRSQEMVYLGPFQGGQVVRGVSQSFDNYSTELCRFVGSNRERLVLGGTETRPGSDVFVYREWSPDGNGPAREREIRSTGLTSINIFPCSGSNCASTLSKSRFLGYRLARCGGGPCVEFCPPGMIDTDEGCKTPPAPNTFVVQRLSGSMSVADLPVAPLFSADAFATAGRGVASAAESEGDAAPSAHAAGLGERAAAAQLTAGPEGACTISTIASGAIGTATAAVGVTAACAAVTAPTAIGELLCLAPAGVATASALAGVLAGGVAYLVCNDTIEMVGLIEAPPEAPLPGDPDGSPVNFRSRGQRVATALCEYQRSDDCGDEKQTARIPLLWDRRSALAENQRLVEEKCTGGEFKYFCRKMARLAQVSSNDAEGGLKLFKAVSYGDVNGQDLIDPYSPRECVVGRYDPLATSWRQSLAQELKKSHPEDEVKKLDTTEHVIDLKFGGLDGPENWVALSGPCNNTIDSYLTLLMNQFTTKADGTDYGPVKNVKNVNGAQVDKSCYGAKLKFEPSNELRDACAQVGINVP